MKNLLFLRVISLVLALLLCMSALLGCNDQPVPDNTPDDPGTDDTPDTPDEPEPEPEPEAPTYRVLLTSDMHCTDLMDWYGLSNEERMDIWYNSVWEEHERQPFDLIIIAGDLSLDTHAGETCYTKGYSTSEIFIEDYVSELPKDVPVIILPGNHESQYDEDWVEMTGNSRQCTYVLGNNTFIMPDTFAAGIGEVDNGNPYTPADVAYIKEQMDAYPENNVYLVAHHFPIDEGMAGESAEFRELLKDERIIGLFGGHTHLNTAVQYNESCGNKIQAQTGAFSGTSGSFDTAFWGFRDLVITEDSAISSYIQVECDAIINGEERHYDRKLTEVVDFMNPPNFNEYTAADGTVYTKLYDYVDYSSITGNIGQLDSPPVCMINDIEHDVWFPLFDGKQQAAITWQMTEPTAISHYVMITGYYDWRCTPTSWTLYAGDSLDSLEPIDVRTKVEMPGTTKTHSEVFAIDPDLVDKYTCYQLVFTGNDTGTPGYEISEMIILAGN